MYGSAVIVPTGANVDKKTKRWLELVKRSQKRRDKELPVWKICDDFKEGKHWNSDFAKNTQVTVNLIGDYIERRLAATSFRNPSFVMRPVKPKDYAPIDVNIYDQAKGEATVDSVPKFRIAENTTNFVAEHPDFHLIHTVHLANQSAMTSMGVAMVGYRADFETIEEPEGVSEVNIDPETGLPDISGLSQNSAGELELDQEGKPLPMVEPTSEQWFCDWVPAIRMLFDPEGGNDFDSHCWVGMELVRPLKDVKKDKLFKHTRDLKGTGFYDSEGRLTARKSKGLPGLDDEQDDEMVRLFYIWDLEEEKFIVLADGHHIWLRYEDTPEGYDRHPFVFLRLRDRVGGEAGECGGDWYYRPPVADLVPLNKVYNELVTQYLNAARRSARKSVGRKNILTPTEISRLVGPDDGVHIEVDVPNQQSLADVFQPVNFPPVSMDLVQGINLVQNAFNTMAGQPAGGRPADSATQASIWESKSGLSEDAHRNLVAKFYALIGKKLYDSIQANMTLEMAVAINGPDGRLHQMIVNRDQIVGDFDVTVDVQEMQPTNQATENAQLIEVLKVWAQFKDLFSDKVVADTITSAMGIRNGAFSDALVRVSQQALAMAQQQAMGPPPPSAGGPPPGMVPGGGEQGAPPDLATMLMQQGGHMGPSLRGRQG